MEKNNRTTEEGRRRVNRRRMAWLSLISILVTEYVLFFWVDAKRLPLLDNFINMYVMCMTSIVLGYLGAATWDNYNQWKSTDFHKSLNKSKTQDSEKIDNPDEPDEQENKKK